MQLKNVLQILLNGNGLEISSMILKSINDSLMLSKLLKAWVLNTNLVLKFLDLSNILLSLIDEMGIIFGEKP